MRVQSNTLLYFKEIMEIPKFDGWVSFKDYKSLKSLNLPGVYVLAHFSSGPVEFHDISSKNIVYVGETTRQTISKRLYQFSRSAFLRKRGHSGGWTYSDLCLDSEIQNCPPDNLYVAVLPVNKPEKESKAYIKLVERLVIWEFFQKNKDYPLCNTA